jgi:hypothetical protein
MHLKLVKKLLKMPELQPVKNSMKLNKLVKLFAREPVMLLMICKFKILLFIQ